jgi:hypothetical protein
MEEVEVLNGVKLEPNLKWELDAANSRPLSSRRVEKSEKRKEMVSINTNHKAFQFRTMSRPNASNPARSLSLTEELEKLEQQITLTLQGRLNNSTTQVKI